MKNIITGHNIPHFVCLIMLCLLAAGLTGCDVLSRLTDNCTDNQTENCTGGLFSLDTGAPSCSGPECPGSACSRAEGCQSSVCNSPIITPVGEYPEPTATGSPPKPTSLIDGAGLPSSTIEAGGSDGGASADGGADGDGGRDGGGSDGGRGGYFAP